MLKAFKARQLAKWCAYGIVLAAPGSLVVLPLWLLRRRWASRTTLGARAAAAARTSEIQK